ncbi:beta-lactamase family protein [Nocardia sp. 2]|uniref:Beta-lactamase family protein n=1 Tax=Nocardia acididurans TaxID=2802282 RepID=A0ABS1M1V1_9NOCA|nr:serine hydrolase domain-containing protein [Nocardia acididurans]MBL1074510.1 beta-lactamase family protein [Nocardia acididurans]
MTNTELQQLIEGLAEKLGVPGVAVGVYHGGRETYATCGVTNIDNPVPVDENTLFVLGSVSKSYAATAIMRLVEDGRIELDAPVRRYVPELRLADERVAAGLTVMHLLNHTGGLAVRVVVDSGEGDDNLARYVEHLPELDLIGEPGGRASYSQAGYNLLARVVEKVTGQTYEQAVATLLFEPLGLEHSAYLAHEVMTRRFAMGHNVDADGTLSVARAWKNSRADNGGGGLASSVSDQLRWARFHLGDGRTANGERLLSTAALHGMRRPTVELRGSNLADAFGICWFLEDIAGAATFGHGGSGNGQFAELLMVPEHDFAVIVLSNSGPDNGLLLNQSVVRWALEHYLGLVEPDPEPLPFDAARAAEIVGDYAVNDMTVTIAVDGARLTMAAGINADVRAASPVELPPDLPAAAMGLLPGAGDEFIVTEGGLKGSRGYFTRDDNDRIIGADLAGRLFLRVQ